MLTLNQRVSVVLVFIITNILLGLASFMPFKILSEEIDISIGLLLLTFNLFMSKKFAIDYANIIFRSNINKKRSKTGG
ncbi:hypothetical protein [Schnuerera ultunensis]|uniref:Uncharacterized protein n=1 Tax=[Clostridium] ultunense Esp TaxID=1288971 RepID=A0A1M4PPJ7_9FIRM|nr:hypothetical protein [Schnuerera ultunensis]SHD77407.1 protein of unknown function [[Clostridium] ultunense Esp]